MKTEDYPTCLKTKEWPDLPGANRKNNNFRELSGGDGAKVQAHLQTAVFQSCF